MRFLILAVAIAAAPALAQSSDLPATAAAPPPMFELYGEGALEYGGDEVIELLFTNGGSQTLTAGQGGTIALGLRARPVASVPVSAFASVGYKVLFNASENADIRMTRFPIEVGATVHVTPDVWAEAAFTRHAAVTLNGDDFFDDVDFGSANGATIAAGWRWVGASFTAITYTAEDGTEVAASNVGITLRGTFARF